jgi:hypothetical protein
MAAASVASNAPARPSGGLATAVLIPLTITLSTTAYATASAGFAFDIAALLNSVGPFDSGINPSDVFFCVGYTADAYSAQQFTVGTPTYTTNTDASSARSQTVSLATCPCTMRLFNGITELGDGNITKTVTGFLIAQRGGRN